MKNLKTVLPHMREEITASWVSLGRLFLFVIVVDNSNYCGNYRQQHHRVLEQQSPGHVIPHSSPSSPRTDGTLGERDVASTKSLNFPFPY